MLKKHIPSLDGFRAISVLIVVFGHLVLNHLLPEPLYSICEQFCFGELGVRIFFVISGFLITYLLLNERTRYGKIDLKAFYIRRVLRIFPVFYFYLFILLLLKFFFHFNIPALHLLSAALYIHNFTPWGGSWFVGHTWSLAVEEQFYLLWPALFTLIKRLNNKATLVIVIVAGSLFRSLEYKFPGVSNYILAPFFMHADFLFSGCFMAFLVYYHYDQVVNFVNRLPSYLVWLSIILIWFFSKYEFHPVYDKLFVPTSGAVVNICASYLIIYFVLKEKTIGYRFLNLPFLRFIGRLSYSLYVWQQLFTFNYGTWWNKFPLNLLAIFAAAYFSYIVIEKPFLRLKDRFKTVPIRPASVHLSK